MRSLALLVVLVVLVSCCVSGGGGMKAPKTLHVGSVFHNGSRIPAEFTCDGDDVNPPLYIGNLGGGVKSLVVIVDDPDAPGGTFTHWIAWNIPPVGEIPEGVPRVGRVEEPVPMVQGRNDFGEIGYGGPCPPRGSVHHYRFRVYALDTTLDLPPGATRDELERAMRGHVLEWGELVGLYSRGS